MAFPNPDVKFMSINVCAFDAFKMDAIGIIADAKDALEKLVLSW